MHPLTESPTEIDMTTLAPSCHPPLRLLERRPDRAPLARPVAKPTRMERLVAWADGLQMSRHHRLGSWMTLGRRFL
jgi:hypothetical protein